MGGGTSEEISGEGLELPNLQWREIGSFRLQIAHQKEPPAWLLRSDNQTRTATLPFTAVRNALLEQTSTQIRIDQAASQFSDCNAATRLAKPNVSTPSLEFARRVGTTINYTIK